MLGEQLVTSFFRLLKVVRIYTGKNQLLLRTMAEFRRALDEIYSEVENANLRIHRGRIYLNNARIANRPAVMGIASRLVEYLNARNIQGLRFYEKDGITNEEIIRFIELLNRSDRQKDPITWLQVQFDSENCTWVEILVDQDFHVAVIDSGRRGGAGSYTMALAALARKTYSNALTSMLSMIGKLSSQKRVGIQRSKRVIQKMVDILMEDESVLLGMSTIRDYDDYTYTHSVNVAILSICLGNRIGLPRHYIECLGLCGIFHDLGKIDIPIELINKQDRLTEEEYEHIKRHSMHSVRQIIRLNADHDLIAKFMLPPFEHHLGIDLSGYPRTDRKAPLSLLGRILAVTDNYDALTSSRSYRSVAINPDRALRIMIENAGTKLDPIILKIFIDMIGVYPVGSLLALDTREVALAVETPESNEDGRPIVRLLNLVDGERLERGEIVDLSERDAVTGKFKRNVVKCCHPSEYGIQPAEFLVSAAFGANSTDPGAF